MNQKSDKQPKIPSDNRDEINRLISRLHEAQHKTADRIQKSANYEKLYHIAPDSNFSVNDILRMWSWHFWAHCRELIRIRGPLINDNPHFHVPHYVRQAYEEFGKFVGELACLSDEYLDITPPEGGRTLRQIIEHVLETLNDYLPEQIEQAKEK